MNVNGIHEPTHGCEQGIMKLYMMFQIVTYDPITKNEWGCERDQNLTGRSIKALSESNLEIKVEM